MSEQAERRPVNGRKNSARAQDERGVSIWTELRMRAGELADRVQKPNSGLKGLTSVTSSRELTAME